MLRGLLHNLVVYPFHLLYLRSFFKVGTRQYFGLIDHFDAIIENEGFFALWNGFMSYSVIQACTN